MLTDGNGETRNKAFSKCIAAIKDIAMPCWFLTGQQRLAELPRRFCKTNQNFAADILAAVPIPKTLGRKALPILVPVL